MFHPCLLALCLTWIAAAAKGHEFWIDPQAFVVGSDDEVLGNLRVGQNFKGSSQSYIPRRFTRFDFALDGAIYPVEGLTGDKPALQISPPGEGLLVVLHETQNSQITWQEFEKFEKFLIHKDAEWVLQAMAARGLPKEKPREIYSRHAKSLIASGHGAGSDQAFGLLTEFVALENPYISPGAEIDFQLFYQLEPRGDAQVEVFEKSPTGEVEVFLLRTDADGKVSVPVKQGFTYQLDAVVLREAPADEAHRAEWQSLWANITFYVPN